MNVLQSCNKSMSDIKKQRTAVIIKKISKFLFFSFFGILLCAKAFCSIDVSRRVWLLDSMLAGVIQDDYTDMFVNPANIRNIKGNHAYFELSYSSYNILSASLYGVNGNFNNISLGIFGSGGNSRKDPSALIAGVKLNPKLIAGIGSIFTTNLDYRTQAGLLYSPAGKANYNLVLGLPSRFGFRDSGETRYVYSNSTRTYATDSSGLDERSNIRAFSRVKKFYKDYDLIYSLKSESDILVYDKYSFVDDKFFNDYDNYEDINERVEFNGTRRETVNTNTVSVGSEFVSEKYKDFAAGGVISLYQKTISAISNGSYNSVDIHQHTDPNPLDSFSEIYADTADTLQESQELTGLDFSIGMEIGLFKYFTIRKSIGMSVTSGRKILKLNDTGTLTITDPFGTNVYSYMDREKDYPETRIEMLQSLSLAFNYPIRTGLTVEFVFYDDSWLDNMYLNLKYIF
jgi:hypothetical protein